MRTGKLIILPSVFERILLTGSKITRIQWQWIKHLDLSNLLVTFICNLTWPEIQNTLGGLQGPEN